jgi:hypothetical protein
MLERKCAVKMTGMLAQPQLWLLHHDNMPAHMLLKTAEFVTNNNIVIVPHPSYLLDLAPCDFALFSISKVKLKF